MNSDKNKNFFEKIKDKFDSFGFKPEQVFTDPNAKEVDWDLAAPNAPFEKEVIHKFDGDIELKTTKSSHFVLLFPLLFVPVFFQVFKDFNYEQIKSLNELIPILSSIIPLFVFIFTWKALKHKVILSPLSQLIQVNNNEYFFNSLLAIQLVKKYKSSKNSHYYIYQVNLVLNDFSRVAISQSKNYHSSRDIADLISTTTKTKLWDMHNPDRLVRSA